MSGRTYDVVMVGGGHNGLACASYLARGGLEVIVLEQRSMPGGAAATEEPWPGYSISTASYVVSLMPEKIVTDLELRRHGYKVSVLEPDYYVPYADGTSLTLWGDSQRTHAEISKFSKADADAYVEFDKYLTHLGALVHDLLYVIPPNLGVMDIPKWLSLGGKVRKWSGHDAAEVVRLFTVSAADFLDEWFENDRVKGALATQAIIGAWCGPMSPCSAYVLLHHWMGSVEGHEGAWGWVHGGMGAVGQVMADSATAAGAEIRLDASVKRIDIRNGRAHGVELEDGTTVSGRRVISSAHPVTTYKDLIGDAHLPDQVVRDINRFQSRSGSVKVNLGLSELPKPKAWDGSMPGDPHTGIMSISPSVDYLERAWDDAKYGRMSEHPYVECVFPTVFEPDLAPEGKHIALCFTQFGPFELAEGSWDDGGRDEYARRVISALSDASPNFEAAVEHVEVLTPKDIEDRFGLLGGNIFQGDMNPEQMFSFRPIPGYADYRTPVAGLYMCGSGTHPGGGVMAVPGYNASRVVLRDVRRDKLTRRNRS
ncbi:MAG: NAD(P)/FAD-dependent oxidoreductase [Actinomycetota bacterium]|nr:NAD(P)/FAD-dependent oxidoreductase [Actinomycetota bacterium]